MQLFSLPLSSSFCWEVKQGPNFKFNDECQKSASKDRSQTTLIRKIPSIPHNQFVSFKSSLLYTMDQDKRGLALIHSNLKLTYRLWYRLNKNLSHGRAKTFADWVWYSSQIGKLCRDFNLKESLILRIPYCIHSYPRRFHLCSPKLDHIPGKDSTS